MFFRPADLDVSGIVGPCDGCEKGLPHTRDGGGRGSPQENRRGAEGVLGRGHGGL